MNLSQFLEENVINILIIFFVVFFIVVTFVTARIVRRNKFKFIARIYLKDGKIAIVKAYHDRDYFRYGAETNKDKNRYVIVKDALQTEIVGRVGMLFSRKFAEYVEGNPFPFQPTIKHDRDKQPVFIGGKEWDNIMTHKLIYEINDIDKKALPTWLLVVGVIFAVIIIGVIVFFVMKEKGMI